VPVIGNRNNASNKKRKAAQMNFDGDEDKILNHLKKELEFIK